MAITARYYRKGFERILRGDVDLLMQNMGLAILKATVPAAALDVDEAADYFGSGMNAEAWNVVDVPEADRDISYEPLLRTYVLTQSPALTYTPAGSEDVRYLALYARGAPLADFPLLALYDLGQTETWAAAVQQTLDVGNLLEFRLFSSLEPAPYGVDVDPLILADSNALSWRTIASAAGALTTVSTVEEAPAGRVFLTSPDAAVWLLGVTTAGALTTTSGQTPTVADTVYDSVTPLIVPSVDPTKLFEITVANDGTLSTVEVP